jgi:hypothetical protein
VDRLSPSSSHFIFPSVHFIANAHFFTSFFMKNVSASLVCLLLALVGLSASAQTIRRVNNSGISGTNIYSQVDAAITASAAGDIIQVEPSGAAYNGFTVGKNVTIVGPGYFLDPSQNPNLQANPLTATVATIDFQSGGAGSSVAGLTVSGDVVLSNGANNVTVQRCNISRIYLNASGSVTLNNLNLKDNYVNQLTNFAPSDISDNMLIANNIIQTVSLPVSFNGGFFNNVVLGSSSMTNFFVTNNYFGSSSFPNPTSNTFANNIGSATTFPTTNGNQANIAQSAVFTLAPGATAFDAWYQLKAGANPARGTGQGGVDVGAFGGTTPYKLGGIPAIPAIYQQSQTITGNSLNGTLSTRANN